MDLELPDRREWPIHGKPIVLGSYDIYQTWLITPSVTKKTLEAYNEVIESPETPSDVESHTRKLIISRYGSWEVFESLEWLAMEMDEAEKEACGTLISFYKRGFVKQLCAFRV
ncbi:Fc.00g055760.m01.CDS01 [Cosmosporella sp. VM-42]